MLCSFAKTETKFSVKQTDHSLLDMVNEDVGLLGSFTTLSVHSETEQRIAYFHVLTKVEPELSFQVLPRWTTGLGVVGKLASIQEFCVKFNPENLHQIEFNEVIVYDIDRDVFDQELQQLGLKSSYSSPVDPMLINHNAARWSTVYYDNCDSKGTLNPKKSWIENLVAAAQKAGQSKMRA